MRFSQYKVDRLHEMIHAQWGDLRLPDLFELLRIARPHHVLETGSYAGVSTEVFALHCASVMTIDPSPNIGVRRELYANVGHYPHVTIVKGYSVPVMHELVRLKKRFDLIYLDGDHSYETVKSELVFASALLPEEGGWIGGHDYSGLNGDTPGVARAVDEAFTQPDITFSDGSWLVELRPSS